nr:ComEC/Rec2 family competence protein [Alicyclobacillus mali (ex Roth et al. 2021)]
MHACAIIAFLASEWSRYVWGWRAAGTAAAVAMALALVGFVWCRDRRLLLVVAASLATGVVAGSVWAAWRPAHPAVPPGARDVIAGEVQSVKETHGRKEIMLAVRGEGEDAHPCHYEALVFVERGPHVDAGQWVEADGTFVASNRVPTAMDILSPLELFDGRVRVLHRAASVGERVTSFMASGMEDGAQEENREFVQLALSMIFGDAQGNLPQNVSADFLAAGVTHLLVASGSNVGFALDMAAIPWHHLFGRARMRKKRLAYGAYALGVIWGFALICGFQLAVLRAACGATYSVAAGMCGRRVSGYTVLWSSAGMAGVLDPADLLTPSMLLSFYAAFAVCEADSLWRRTTADRAERSNDRRTFSASAVRRVGASLVRAFLVTAVVDAYMVPVLWWMFRQWTPYGALSTAILEPTIELLMPLIVLWGLTAGVAHALPWPPIAWCAQVLSRLGCASMFAVVWFVHRVASWHGSLRSLAPASFASACALVFALVAVAHVRMPRRHG